MRGFWAASMRRLTPRAPPGSSFGSLAIGIIGDGACRRAHIDGVVIVLYGDRDAVQRSDEISGSGKILVLHPRRFEGVEHLRVIVSGVGLRALAANVERHVGVHLAGVLDRGD